MMLAVSAAALIDRQTLLTGILVIVFAALVVAVTRWLWNNSKRIAKRSKRKWHALDQLLPNGESSLRDAVDWCVAAIAIVAEAQAVTDRLPPKPKPAQKEAP